MPSHHASEWANVACCSRVQFCGSFIVYFAATFDLGVPALQKLNKGNPCKKHQKQLLNSVIPRESVFCRYGLEGLPMSLGVQIVEWLECS